MFSLVYSIDTYGESDKSNAPITESPTEVLLLQRIHFTLNPIMSTSCFALVKFNLQDTLSS
jgi:hypothetical protein